MPGLDIGHIVLVMGIALMVFGPDRLREIARTLGQTVNELRRSGQGLPNLLSTDALSLLEDGAALSPLFPPGGGEIEGQAGYAPEAGEMTLSEHFAELRRRLVWGAAPVLLAGAVCFFFSDPILRLLKGPAGATFQINAFGPMDGFAIRWKIALYAGLVLSSPNWIYQLVTFIAPAMTSRERRFFIPTLIAAGVLFVLGTVFGYVLLGGMVRVLFSMFGREITYLPNANQYISFVVFFMLACGIVFELPAVLLVLVRFGILQPAMLRRQRKIAYFLLFVFAEIVTPVADPIVAPMIVMLPLVVLYEGAIFATRWVMPAGERAVA
jgi:sec-independent protein translocase protein TatC